MFHIVTVLFITLISPLLSIIINALYNKQKQIPNNIFLLFCNWFILWSLGIRLFSAGLMQLFNPVYTASLLQINSDSHIIIQELGSANIAFGLLCIISFFKHYLQKYICLSLFIFLSIITVNHLLRISYINFEEFISSVNDIFLIIISLYGFVYNVKINKNI
jgi:hypothetical protein